DIGRLGGQYVLSARIVGALDGEVLATFRETAADSTELVGAVDRLAKGVREKVGESLRSIRQSPYLMAITTPSLPALKKLVQAQDASNRGDEPRALALLEEAIALDPEFSEAHRKRGAILFNRGRVTEALAAFERALERPDRLTDYERYHTRALVAEVRGNSSQAISEYQALLEIDSTDTRALNNLGVIYDLMGQRERSADAYRRAIDVLESDSTEAVFAGTYLGAATAAWNLGRRDSARALIDRLEELSPGIPSVWVGRSQMASASGDYDEALDHARILKERFPANRDAPLSGRQAASIMYAVRGQIRRAATELDELMGMALAAGEPGWALGSGARAALLQASVLGDTTAALRTLASVRSTVPLDSVSDPPLALLAVTYAATGRLDSARVMTERLRDRPEWFQRSYPYLVPAAEAAIAGAEGDYGAAESGWRRADATEDACRTCFKARIGLMEELQGNRADAIAAYEEYLGLEQVNRAGWGRRGWMPDFEGDFLHRGLVLERLADLHEQAGSPAEAARYYRELIDLWEDADPELQPRVDAARRALERLAAEGG
ncbi:MAG: tetratricopeptide repeat protein, partial [Longimicrobiales bacterium]|nr:tetratricopeptide repeat protein [Longimicrobiales bacterium]